MSIRQHGITLTYAENLDQLDDCMRRGGYDTVKVIAGWGLPQAWTRADRERILKYPNVIVPTVAGDPSAANPFSAPLTAMIAALAEQERDATARRAQASTAGASFSAADEIELRRVQAFQASLEAALSCAGDNSSEAQALIEAAARQALVWRERQSALR